MPSYLVEQYLPKSRLGGASASKRAAPPRQPRSSRATACRIRYLRTTFLPDDETCFHLVEAEGAEDVGELCRRAGLTNARVTPAVEA